MTTPRLAARAGARQVEVVLRADRAVAAVNREALAAQAEILRDLEPGRGPNAASILRGLPGRLRAVLRRHLADTLLWCHRSARHHLAREVPYRSLAWAARHRAPRRRRLRESFDWADLLAPWRDVEAAPSLAELLALLFPAPTLEYAQDVVHEGDWESRIKLGSGLAEPTRVAHRVAVGLSLGHTPAQIEREIRPAVQNVAASARRLARTESMRVAARVQMDLHAGLGDLVEGYQIHATLDERTRPEHRARDGTVYWARPGPGQLGYESMPRPPQEADGSMAWSCRCFLVPVLRDPGNDAPAPPPGPADQLVYSDWFARTSERKRRLAVGTARYDVVRDLAGEETPGWEHFIDLESGKLLGLDALRAEDDARRGRRVAQARATMALRRRAKADVLARGRARG